jgi:hypothetical protein
MLKNVVVPKFSNERFGKSLVEEEWSSVCVV